MCRRLTARDCMPTGHTAELPPSISLVVPKNGRDGCAGRSEGRWAIDRRRPRTRLTGGRKLARGGDDTDASVYLMVREYNDAVELGEPKRPIMPCNPGAPCRA
jgi:hypothetical protein